MLLWHEYPSKLNTDTSPHTVIQELIIYCN